MKSKASNNGPILSDLLRFEHLLSEISAKHIDLPVGSFEANIVTDLGRLVRFLRDDEIALFPNSLQERNR
ncbi:MAG: hypothetical protein ABSH25_07120 [Syntrophorhabdales bacterium]